MGGILTRPPMTGSKRPSTSSLRRFLTSRPYVPIAEIRRRFLLDEPDAICRIERDGEAAYLGLPEREAQKIADMWARDEIGLELSVEVRARVVVGIYPMRIARFVSEHPGVHGHPAPHPIGAEEERVPPIVRPLPGSSGVGPPPFRR
jgi:hypothetical protein